MEGPGLWPIYHPRIPPVLRHLAATPPVARLRQVGMNCGCEYTDFPRFRRLAPYSRFRHSVGVGLIVWHFTGDAAQAAAGLLHDVSTPVFAHVVDFLNGDHLTQTSTERGTAA
jgi:HD superfamily phosphohydrolase